MQRKLKSVFRSSSSRQKAFPDQSEHESDAISPQSARVDRRATSLDEQRRRQPADSYKAGARHTGRSRPLSSAYDSRRPYNDTPASVSFDHAQPRSSEPVNESIARDYKAYLPVLAPVDDSYDAQFMTLGGDRRLITRESEGHHGEDVADRNINQHRTSLDVSKRKPLPATPGMCIDQSTVLHEAVAAILMKNFVNGFAVLDTVGQEFTQKGPTGAGAGYTSSTPSNGPSAAMRKNSLGRNVAVTDGLQDSVRPHAKHNAYAKGPGKSAWPSTGAREGFQLGRSRRKSRNSESEDEAPRTPPNALRSSGAFPSSLKRTSAENLTAVDGQVRIEKEIEQLLGGVVDLRDTVDEDKDVQWAPAVTHEIVKPHEHEVIQHKIFREIHNYEYYHRIQPVYDIEVLPPRHWIPNPNGEGLVEISADKVSSRTGSNRKWKIVHEHVEPSADTRPMWRTEPEIIEHPTTITEEGFERRETTILYPPTLADMTEYDGLVQPVHFDHKTGERWLGQITTMHKLREDMGAVADPNLSLKELEDNLPEAHDAGDVLNLSQSPELRRKPVQGIASARLGEFAQDDRIAIAV